MASSQAQHVTALLERIGRLLIADAHAGALLPVHWEALRYLEKANRFSRTAAALTAFFGITKGTVSQTLGALEKKGLVKKLTNSQDRRSKLLSLTPAGRKLLRDDPLIATIKAVEQMPFSTQRSLGKGLERLLNLRLTAQARQPFGQCSDCRFFAFQHADGGPHFCQLLHEKLAKTDADRICYEQLPA